MRMIAATLAAAYLSHSVPGAWDDLCSSTAQGAIQQFKSSNLKEEDISLVVMTRPKGEEWKIGGYRPNFAMYPASVVKLFYLAHAGSLLQAKKLRVDEEHKRAFKDMIVDSSNDATGLVLDLLTGTTGGPTLGEKQLASWMKKRQRVNEWLKSLGLKDTNACQKTWNEGPYGREKQGYGKDNALRNMSTAQDSAFMMAAILDGKSGNQESTDWMMSLLKRDLTQPTTAVKTFIGKVVPQDCLHYSKAGWAYEVRHDVAAIRTPSGLDIILAVYTDHHGKNMELVPYLAEQILKGVGVVKPEANHWSDPADAEGL